MSADQDCLARMLVSNVGHNLHHAVADLRERFVGCTFGKVL